MALIYDFDKTLSPKDMQEFHILKRFGYDDPSKFWEKCSKISNEHNMDGILSYMLLMAKEDPDISLNAENREIGGLGIYMVKKSMDDVTYKREDNKNILTIRKRIH